jgi:YHS domain-containing protein
MRGLLILAGLVLCFIILAPMLRGWRPWLRGGGDRPDQLVKDPFCGTYVLRSRALRRESGGEALHFCSADCAARFAKGERPI